MTNAVRPAKSTVQAAFDLALGADVDRRGRLVEDQDARIGEERACERDELALAEREPEAALAELRVVRRSSSSRIHSSAPTAAAASSISAHELRRGRPKAMFSATVPAKRNPSCGTMPSCRRSELLRDVAEVVPVDRDPALARVVEAGEQLRDRRLARSRLTDERDGRACGNLEVDVVQDLGQLAVAEADVVEVDSAGRPVAARSRSLHRRSSGSSSRTSVILSSAAIADRNVL